MADLKTLGVGMVGYSFMGAAHSQAWRNAARFFDLPVEAVFSLEPFGQLGADALMARPTVLPD